ncbi:MAG: entericidin EcnAB [Sulfurovum sp.]|nr:entericidin EcnAB [Sulfurovum sp.]
MMFTLFTVLLFWTSGCTNTVHGIQEDSSNAWRGTKGVIHDATAD